MPLLLVAQDVFFAKIFDLDHRIRHGARLRYKGTREQLPIILPNLLHSAFTQTITIRCTASSPHTPTEP
jgi:hypothetical protein